MMLKGVMRIYSGWTTQRTLVDSRSGLSFISQMCAKGTGIICSRRGAIRTVHSSHVCGGISLSSASYTAVRAFGVSVSTHKLQTLATYLRGSWIAFGRHFT